MKNVCTSIQSWKAYFGAPLLLFIILLGLNNSAKASLSSYGFTKTAGVYVPISGGMVVSSPTGGEDDEYTPALPIGKVEDYTINIVAQIACTPITISPAPSTLNYTNGIAIADITLGASGGAANASYTYTITAGTLPAGLSLSNGLISGIPTGIGSGSFTITATSSPGNCSGSATYNFTVVCLPITITPANTTLNFINGTAIGNINFGTIGGAFGANYTFSIIEGALPAGLELISGVVSGTPTTVETGSFTLRAIASPGNCIGIAVYTFTVGCTPITISPAPSLLVFTNGIAIADIILGAGGGTTNASYTYSIGAGILPAGLTLTNGVVSGTPTQIGSGSFTIRATSTPGNCIGTAVYSFAVSSPNCTPIIITPPNRVLSIQMYVPFTTINLGATGGVAGASYTFAVTAGVLPGLTLSPSGVLSGTGLGIGPGSFTVTATSTPGNCSGSAVFTYYAFPPPCFVVVVTPGSGAINFTVGVPITPIVFGANDNRVGYTFVYQVIGTLPPGLTLINGVLSGTPTSAGTGTFRIVAVSIPLTCMGANDFTFTTNPASCTTAPTLMLTPVANALDTLAKATVGVPYNQTFAATGIADATYTYLRTGALPAGLSFASTASSATITGTPSTVGVATFIVRATSNGGCMSSGTTYKLVVRQQTSTNNALSNSLKVYPNPSSNDFNVDFNGLNISKATVCVYDAQGKKVFSSDVKTNQMTISLGKLASGIYLMEVQTSEGRMVKKLAKW